MDEKYFISRITTDVVDNETGKVKKMKEEKLVKGYSPTDVEAKVTKIFENYSMVLFAHVLQYFHLNFQ